MYVNAKITAFQMVLKIIGENVHEILAQNVHEILVLYLDGINTMSGRN